MCDMTHVETAWHEGFETTDGYNPYEPGTVDHRAWENGYMYAGHTREGGYPSAPYMKGFFEQNWQNSQPNPYPSDTWHWKEWNNGATDAWCAKSTRINETITEAYK